MGNYSAFSSVACNVILNRWAVLYNWTRRKINTWRVCYEPMKWFMILLKLIRTGKPTVNVLMLNDEMF